MLTAMSEFWFGLLGDIVPNHLITTDVEAMGPEVAAARGPAARPHHAGAGGPQPILAECVVRGYITGSGWKDYQASGEICGIPIREGMQQAEPFDELLFTPATKAEDGHDENIDFETFCATRRRRTSPSSCATSRSASTRPVGTTPASAASSSPTRSSSSASSTAQITLIDEVLTPDSSRFWDVEEYARRHLARRASTSRSCATSQGLRLGR